MLEELNNGSDQAVGTAAEQYEKHKEALEELLKKKVNNQHQKYSLRMRDLE